MTATLVPALGTMTLTGGYGSALPEDPSSVLRHAVEHGVALIDTADAYIGGEALVASVSRATGHPFRIVTKVGLTGPPGRRLICGRPDYLTQACEASLRRLGGEQLDVLLLHRVDSGVPVEESMGALGALMAAGKVAQIGLCTGDPDALRAAAGAAPISWVQSALSVLSPDATFDLLPVARELGVKYLAHSPLYRGLVVGCQSPGNRGGDDARAFIPEMTAPRPRSRARAFRQLAHDHGASAVDLALGWLTSLGPDVVPIPGARTRGQVTQNLQAQRQELPADLVRALDKFVRMAWSSGRADG